MNPLIRDRILSFSSPMFERLFEFRIKSDSPGWHLSTIFLTSKLGWNLDKYRLDSHFLSDCTDIFCQSKKSTINPKDNLGQRWWFQKLIWKELSGCKYWQQKHCHWEISKCRQILAKWASLKCSVITRHNLKA